MSLRQEFVFQVWLDERAGPENMLRLAELTERVKPDASVLIKMESIYNLSISFTYMPGNQGVLRILAYGALDTRQSIAEVQDRVTSYYDHTLIGCAVGVASVNEQENA